jgi:hypothetical protein
MSQAEVAAGRKPVGSTRAWIGLIVPPTAWAAQLYLGWAFAEVVACAPANRTFGEVLGLGVDTFTGVLNAVLLAASVLSGVLAVTELRSRRRREDPTPAARATELARAGVISSVLFSILIAASFVVVASVSCR